jgi:hypothetical protein
MRPSFVPQVVLLALLLEASHAAVLFTLGTRSPGPLLSNLIQLALGLLCVAVSLAVSRGPDRFARQFMLLVTADFGLWCLAQWMGTFGSDAGDDFLGKASEWIFHLEHVPLAVALFLAPAAAATRLEATHFLEFTQAVILYSAAYLYCLHLPQGSPGVGFIVATNAIITGAFFLRAMTTLPGTASSLFGRWVPMLLLSTVNDAYSRNDLSIAETGQPTDLMWSCGLLIGVLTAVTWRGHQPAVDRTVPLLPLVFSFFVIALCVGVARHELGAAVVLAGASLGCTGVRTWLTLSRRKNIAHEEGAPG